MKPGIFLTLAFFCFLTSGFGQQHQAWSKWNWLIGNWTGEGDGKTGKGSGTFTFKPDLDSNVLIRRNHAEYPAADKPKIIHDDLMIVYPDQNGNASNAIYFDNEGHTINYTIKVSDKSIVFTSDKKPNIPVFRLTYDSISAGSINVRFEMSRDGENFMIYTEGKCKKL
jgi:hypothetical protein